jgi:hypothetical protein
VVEQLTASSAVPSVTIDAVQQLAQELGGEVHVGPFVGGWPINPGQVR